MGFLARGLAVLGLQGSFGVSENKGTLIYYQDHCYKDPPKKGTPSFLETLLYSSGSKRLQGLGVLEVAQPTFQAFLHFSRKKGSQMLGRN